MGRKDANNIAIGSARWRRHGAVPSGAPSHASWAAASDAKLGEGSEVLSAKEAMKIAGFIRDPCQRFWEHLLQAIVRTTCAPPASHVSTSSVPITWLPFFPPNAPSGAQPAPAPPVVRSEVPSDPRPFPSLLPSQTSPRDAETSRTNFSEGSKTHRPRFVLASHGTRSGSIGCRTRVRLEGRVGLFRGSGSTRPNPFAPLST